MEEPEYIVTADGRREMSEESQRKRTFSYLGDLWPTEWSNNTKNHHKVAQTIYNGIKNDPYLPTLILFKVDIHKTVFTSALNAFSVTSNNSMPKWQQTSVSHGTQQYLNSEYHDIADEFNGVHVLLVTMGGEIKNILHPQTVRSYAVRRQERGLATFFFLQGTLADLRSSKWTISDNYDDKGNPIDSIHLDRYVRVIDLNKEFKDKGIKKGEEKR